MVSALGAGMQTIPPSPLPERRDADLSIGGFFSLAAISGTTIGMASIVTQLFALKIGATPIQIGVIGAMEATGMMLLTLPAGFIIARHGAKRVYSLASLGPLFLYALMPLLGAWWAVAAVRLAIGTCIPFRTVSMTSAFIGQLARIGHAKAGWYRAFFSAGMAVIGPALATLLTGNVSFLWCYLLIAGLFGLMALFSLSFFPEKEDAAGIAKADQPAFAQVAALLSNRDVSESCAIEFLSGATGAMFSTFILLVAGSLPGLTNRDGVTVILADGLVTIAFLFLGAGILRHLTRRQAYAAGLLLATSALGLAANAGGLAGLIAGGVMLSIGSALVHLVNMVLLSNLPGEKSKASGLYQLSSMLGAATGALSGGVLSKIFGIGSLFLAWIPILLAVALPIWLLGRRSRQSGVLSINTGQGDPDAA
jgi:MFS family permease